MTATLIDGTEAARYQWSREHDWCFLCFRSADEAGSVMHREICHFQTHEIERRSAAKKALVFLRVNLFRACSLCHGGLLATMPHARQLAYAFFSDPERAPSIRAMLDEWLTIRCGRTGPDRVTVEEVELWLDDMAHGPHGIIGWRKHTAVREHYLLLTKERTNIGRPAQ